MNDAGLVTVKILLKIVDCTGASFRKGRVGRLLRLSLTFFYHYLFIIIRGTNRASSRLQNTSKKIFNQ